MARTTLLALTFTLLSCGEASKFEGSAEEQLIAAIDALDADEVERLLANGADPLKATASGQRALKPALEAVTGTKVDEKFGSKEFPKGDPGLRILRAVMVAARKQSHEPFEAVGRLTHAIQMGPFDPNRGRVMVSYFHVVPESGEKAELAFSLLETDYIGIKRERDGIGVPVMPTGAVIKVTGAMGKGFVEATRIELIEPSNQKGDGYPASTPNYLPSTWDTMVAETWLKEFVRTREKKK